MYWEHMRTVQTQPVRDREVLIYHTLHYHFHCTVLWCSANTDLYAHDDAAERGKQCMFLLQRVGLEIEKKEEASRSVLMAVISYSASYCCDVAQLSPK
jgi:hypothetical protein